MVAGGSGITPMFQVCAAILGNRFDSTRIWLVYANVAEEDILLHEKLDEWARTERARFKARGLPATLLHRLFSRHSRPQAPAPMPQVHYVLESPPDGWSMGKGRVCKEILDEHLPLPNEGVMVLRCGPPGMNRAVEALLDAAGHTKDMLFEF